MKRGVLYGLAAYTIWGLLPIYWKLLAHVPAFEIMSQRIVWLLVILVVLLLIRQQWDWLTKLRQGRVLFSAAIAALLLAAAAPAHAAKNKQDAARQAARQYDAAKILSVKTVQQGNRKVHVVKLLTRDGVVKTVRVPDDGR